MRVAITTNWEHQWNTAGGVYTRELIGALAKHNEGAPLQLILVGRNPRPMGGPNVVSNVRYRALPGALWMVSHARALRRLEGAADVIHEPHLAAAHGLGAPLVMTLNHIGPKQNPELATPAQRLHFTHVLPMALEGAHAVIVSTSHAREELLRHYSVARERVHVIPLGSDHIPAGPRSREATTGSAASRELPFFLAVGTGTSKGVTQLLAAFERVWNEEHGRVELCIVGKPSAQALAQVEQMGPAGRRVHFKGALTRERLTSLFHGARAVICHALSGTSGLVALEAMRARATLIVPRTGSLPELCGEAAMQASIEDPEDLSRAMGRALEPHLGARMSEVGFARCHDMTWSKTAVETIRVYEEVAGPVQGMRLQPLIKRSLVSAA